VGELSLGEAELCLEVSGQVGGGLNGGEDAGVDGLLVFLALSGGGVFGLGRLEDSFLGGFGSLGTLEVGVVDTLWDLDRGDVDLGGGGDDVGGGNTSQRHTVNLVGASDEGKAGVQLLQENASLSTVGSGEKDAYGTGGEGSTEGSLVLGERLLPVSVDLASDSESGVVLGRAFGSNLSGSSVLISLDSLGDDSGGFFGLDLGDGLGALVLGTSSVHLGARVLGHTAGQETVAGHVYKS